jgi:hexosaminidase
VPAGVIVDRPRFAWRGAMLDVARHFFTVAEVKQYIDGLALYKINVLHLHLSDDQGWRIEIRSRPRLTELGASTLVGGGPGGFYTQAEYGEIVRYAQERYITVVPEIDMPAHTNAALVAYPELSCSRRPPAPYTGTEVGFSALCPDREETYRLVEDVVRELAAITPGPYLHMGGDEVEMLTHDQYVGFIERVQEIVTRAGKRMVGWEEVGKARLLPTALAQQWKSDSATAALRSGAKLILSPATRAYLDMKYDRSSELGQDWAARVELRDAYDWDPVTIVPGVKESDVVGVEAPLWTETVKNLTAAQYLAFPRLPAIAEIGWTPAAGRDWESFRLRLAAQAPRWHVLGINYYRSPQIPWGE